MFLIVNMKKEEETSLGLIPIYDELIPCLAFIELMWIY